MMSRNSSGVVSRPLAWMPSWKALCPVLNGGAPIEPAAACWFCARIAAVISSTVRLRAAARSGSIQIRML